MNKTEIMNKMSRSIHKVGFTLKKHSPEILLVTGVVGVVGSAVLACRATTKINLVMDDHNRKVDIIKEGVEKGEVLGKREDGTEGMVPYSEEDGLKDTKIVHAKTCLEFVKLYGPSVILGAASIGCILASHNIVKKRNVALAAAYATVDKGFKEYRGRVVERFGKELDRELKYNIKAREVEEVVVDENGESRVEKTVVNDIKFNVGSDYSRFFDETCMGWTKDREYNLMFLNRIQSQMNRTLTERGYVYLNEVYEALGLDKTPAGHVVGWIYDESPNWHGDNFIDFGIWDLHDPDKRAFVNGKEHAILLDFNTDGNIYELMCKRDGLNF